MTVLFTGGSAGQALVRDPTQPDGSRWSAALTLNVKDYGAVMDGVTNDTVAVQATIDAASAAGGGVAAIPAGICVAGMIQLKSNVFVRGAGKSATTVKLPNNTATTSTNGSTADSNGHYGLSVFCNVLRHDLFPSSRATDPNNTAYLITNCGVMDMTIDGNLAGQTGFVLGRENWAALASCVGFFNVGYGVIQRCRMINGAAYPIMIGYSNQGGSDYCRIYDNDILSYNVAGVGIAMITGKFNEFRGNSVDNSAIAAFDCEPNIANEQTYGNRVIGNKFDGAVYFQPSLPSMSIKDSVIDGNIITVTGTNNTSAIRLDHDTSSGSRISHNRLYGNGQSNNLAIAIIQGSNDVAAPREIVNNTATGFTWFFGTTNAGIIASAPQYRFRISGNVYSGKFFAYLAVPFDLQVTDNIATLSGGANEASAVVLSVGDRGSYPNQGNFIFARNILHGSGVTTQFQTQDNGSWTDVTWTPDFLILDDNIWDITGNAANPFILTRSFMARRNTFRQVSAALSITTTSKFVLQDNRYFNAGAEVSSAAIALTNTNTSDIATWVNQTGSRVSATTYRNTSGKTRTVSVSLSGVVNGILQVTWYADSATPPTGRILGRQYNTNASSGGNAHYGAAYFLVPNGWYYQVLLTSGAIESWQELDA